MTAKQYKNLINKVTDMESWFFEKEAIEAKNKKEDRRDKLITLTIIILAMAILIGNLLEWGLR